MRVVIRGNPITKKNSQVIVGVGRQCPICKRRAHVKPLPSKAFRAYEKIARAQLFGVQLVPGLVAVCCRYWLPTVRRPDLTNLLAASHDILEVCGIIQNDANIMSVDGSRIVGKDAASPRVEIDIEPWQGEVFAAGQVGKLPALGLPAADGDNGQGVSLAGEPIAPPRASQGFDFSVRGSRS